MPIISAEIDDHTNRELLELARRNDLNKSQLVRRMVRKFLDDNKPQPNNPEGINEEIL